MHIFIILTGILCIMIAVYLIQNINDKESKIYNDILGKYDEIIEYSYSLNEIIDNLDKLVEKGIESKPNLRMGNLEKTNTTVNVERQSIEKQLVENQPIENKQSQVNHLNRQRTNELKINDLDIEQKLQHQVLELYKKGMSNEGIAKELKKGVREVDIIIKVLRSKKYIDN